MADTGFVIAGQGRAVNRSGGSTAWTNPGNITADDATNATVSLFAQAGSHWLVADTFDFSSIPDGSTITGIEARAQMSCSAATNAGITAVNIGKDDSTPGTAKAPGTTVGTSVTDYTYGTASDLWGLSISVAELKSSTFQALFACRNADTFSQRTLSCDAIWMRVTYTPPPPSALPPSPNPYANALTR